MLKKYLFLLFSLVIVLQLNAQVVTEKSGGFARMQAMGANPYIIDPFNMTINPAWSAYYDDFLMGDLGSTNTAFGNDGTGQFVGVNLGVTSQLTLGVLLTRNDFSGMFSIAQLDPTSVISELNDAVGAGLTPLNNNLEIFGSFKTGPHKFGFALAYAATSREFNPATGDPTEASASQLGLTFGYIGSMGSKLLLDAAFSLVMPGGSYTPAGGNESSVSQTNIGLNVRAFYELSQKFKLVPAFTFQSYSGSIEVASGTTTDKSDLPSTSVIVIGMGVSYKTGDFLFAGGPSFATITQTTPSVENVRPELATTTTLFPSWNLGAEWGMLDWLWARFGYISITGSVTTETAASSSTVNETINTLYGPTGAYVGLGFKLGNLSIDGTVNSDVLRQGLNNIGGGGATFAYLSLSVAF
ncbi:MAG: hypothetical protein KDC88_06605 [Ignavibacteriae bacterium]|nr:hypothetical protein [Ignavibacteriota bacterium]MCB9207892.1 hypothetical protein [Ignavibacteriales bacterium]MCB9258662.1 hypothetical protein [Ignavibacteriales bacterium]